MISRRAALAVLALAALCACRGDAQADPRACALDLRARLTSQARVLLPAGDCLIPADLAPLPLGSIEGVGERTRIVAAPGTRVLFEGRGRLSLSQLALIGSGTGVAYTSGGAIAVEGDVHLDSVALDNWRASYWVAVTRGTLEARGVVAVSQPGAATDGTRTSYVAAVFSLHESTALIEDSSAHLEYAKQFVAVWAGSSATVRRVMVANVGTSSEISDDAGAYAFLAYWQPQAGARPSITVEDSEVSARSAGIYAASADTVISRRNRYSGVRDAHDETIPKGALAMNHVRDFISDSDTFADCRTKVMAVNETTKNVIR